MSVVHQYTVESDLTGPSIAPVSPLANDVDVAVDTVITFKLEDPSSVVLSTVVVQVNGLLVYSASSEQNGATVTATANDAGGFDFSVALPASLPDGGPQAVYVSADDTLANTSTLLYTFFTGVKPRLVSVDNTVAGIIVARFNEPMTLDSVFRRIQNYVITALGSGSAVTVTEIRTSTAQPDVATIVFEGGGSSYELVVTGVLDAEGNSIDLDYNTLAFEIGLPGGDTAPIVHVFDTVFGPMGITQRVVSRRTVEKLVVNRAIDVAIREQLNQRLEAYGAGAPLRSGKDGGRRG
ncbi:hypothetical protein LCGC14_1644020 [marine sediment metagenome]|uniref:Uncharacterized protein n=1 Tax=marine sediment metagenome TaxID=412755 RepID=A0A0F9KEP9_9ZZZZ